MMDKPSGTKQFVVHLFAGTLMLLLMAACNANETEINARVAATLTEESIRADAVNTSVAASLQALPTSTIPPTQAQATETAATQEPTEASAAMCEESMSDLFFLSAGHLAGSRILVTLQKPSEFEADTAEGVYTLRMRGVEYPCSILNDNQQRIYCSGRPVPPPGLTAVSLVASDGSCTYDIPFDTINIPPKPTEKPSGGY
jgi:hypothetical protein